MSWFEILVKLLLTYTRCSLTCEKKEWLLNLACLGFLYITLNVFSADPLLLKSPIPLEMKQFLVSVLVFEQIINNDSVQTYHSDLAWNWYPDFHPFFKIFKPEFLIQDLISWLIVNKNEISVNQNLSLGVDNQKQIKFWK